MEHEAIYQLYPSVKTIDEVTTGDFVCKDIDGNEVAINASDVSAKAIELAQAETDTATQKATDKTSGNAKLLGLGLTQAEATAMTGYTPE